MASQVILPDADIVTTGWTVPAPSPNETLIDDFNRANATIGPGAVWDGQRWGSTSAPLDEVFSNTFRHIPAQAVSKGVAMASASIGPDLDLVLDVVTVPATGNDMIEFFFRAASVHTASANGYSLQVTGSASGNWQMLRYDSASSTAGLGVASTKVLAIGDSIWVKARDVALEAWHKTSGGAWTRIVNRPTDGDTFNRAGVFGLGGFGNTGSYDNLRGGTYPGSSPAPWQALSDQSDTTLITATLV